MLFENTLSPIGTPICFFFQNPLLHSQPKTRMEFVYEQGQLIDSLKINLSITFLIHEVNSFDEILYII